MRGAKAKQVLIRLQLTRGAISGRILAIVGRQCDPWWSYGERHRDGRCSEADFGTEAYVSNYLALHVSFESFQVR